MPEPAAVNSMFARIASRYDIANRLLSGGIDRWWRRKLVAAVKRRSPSSILDLATGSGDVAFALSRSLPRGVRILGMDFCQPMLAEAEKKQRAAHSAYPNITFRQGDGLNLPLEAELFDAVTISFGLRNMADRHRSLSEMRRVLRSGGHLFVLEFSQPQHWFRPLYFFYLRRVLPVLAGWVTGDRAAYQYLNETIEHFPSRAALEKELVDAGFSAVHHRGMTFGIVALHRAMR